MVKHTTRVRPLERREEAVHSLVELREAVEVASGEWWQRPYCGPAGTGTEERTRG
ncbi:hypothetical protein [Streptomyces scopuliridis]|uniref:hypothetical protein n=1 Tax=Streptomyces scopuliridis TaxID=452529 RepID=UPI003695384C